MTNKNLTQRLNFGGQTVLLDGAPIYTVPGNKEEGRINFLGVPKNENFIYVGSGEEFSGIGSFSSLFNTAEKEEVPKFQPDRIRTFPFDVMDAIPLFGSYKEKKFRGEGYHHDSGVCLVSGGHGELKIVHHGFPFELVSYEESKKIREGLGLPPDVRTKLDIKGNEIRLNLCRGGEILSSIDIMPRIKGLGFGSFNLPDILQANQGYIRIR